MFPAEATYVCDKCLGPLEPVYDYAAIHVTRAEIEQRPKNLWRYRELLPITGEPLTGFHSGFTPLVRCDRLAERLGLSELYLKDDSVNHPTLSYKDRVVSVAATRAVELGFKVISCASTGNLANSVSAHAARLGLECCVFIPDNLEPGKILGSAIYRPTILAIAGNYDDVNRLCTQVADRYGMGVRQHQPAVVLRRRREDDGFRDRRAARLALPAPCGLARGGRNLAASHPPRASASSLRSASSRVSCRVSMRLRPRVALRSFAPSRRASSIRSWCVPTPSRSRLRSAIRPMATRCSSRYARPEDRERRSRTSRSSTPSSCSPKPKESSRSRPAAPRSRRRSN